MTGTSSVIAVFALIVIDILFIFSNIISLWYSSIFTEKLGIASALKKSIVIANVMFGTLFGINAITILTAFFLTMAAFAILPVFWAGIFMAFFFAAAVFIIMTARINIYRGRTGLNSDVSLIKNRPSDEINFGIVDLIKNKFFIIFNTLAVVIVVSVFLLTMQSAQKITVDNFLKGMKTNNQKLISENITSKEIIPKDLEIFKEYKFVYESEEQAPDTSIVKGKFVNEFDSTKTQYKVFSLTKVSDRWVISNIKDYKAPAAK